MSTSCSDVCEAIHEALLNLGFKISDDGDHQDMLDAFDKVYIVRKDLTFEQIWDTMLKTAPDRADYCAEWWGLNDIKEQAEQDEEELTDEEARAALAYIERKRSAQDGINWDTISDAIHNVIAERKPQKKAR